MCIETCSIKLGYNLGIYNIKGSFKSNWQVLTKSGSQLEVNHKEMPLNGSQIV